VRSESAGVEVDRLSSALVVVAPQHWPWIRAVGYLRTVAGTGLTINDPGMPSWRSPWARRTRHALRTASYFSSKGPTGDGRIKPDLVAPGEKILSCAAGKLRDDALAQAAAGHVDQATGSPPAASDCLYVEDSGTSMAAPHVSGVIAAFLSIRREFIGRPEDVKRIFTESATDLNRDRYFQGRGLVDLMRAIQSV
jgi:subtilisin family serine protease